MAIYGNSEAIRLGAAQTIAPAGASASSTAFGTETFQILVTSTAAVNFRIGSSPQTAVATDTLLPANFPFRLYVTPGQIFAALGTATVSVTEIV